ncbi:GNAT family N-acetyltransferase [Demequina mangrovi]|uniref:Acetyltransferase (GNAT) domain-containing protein n=1 Tax=Demequina mangrovi TaxID=1043493 RepID=A0A1H6UMD2_9MICO|nr:GNAT family N-acetyltransferase [Demequina mangrovi]SEI89225.1 Acetyltransferase (GNAT) domain-containing protein [Demequina mangrovi]
MTEVRPATPEDAAEIVHLGALMYKAVGTKPTPSWAAESTRTVRERLGRDLFGMVIDAPEGGLAACGLVNVAPRLARPGAEASEMGYIQWVSTAPQHQRKGYARAIMEALLLETDRRGIEVVELHASPAGLHLYQDLGFFIKHDNVAMTAQRLRPRR